MAAEIGPIGRHWRGIIKFFFYIYINKVALNTEKMFSVHNLPTLCSVEKKMRKIYIWRLDLGVLITSLFLHMERKKNELSSQRRLQIFDFALCG